MDVMGRFRNPYVGLGPMQEVWLPFRKRCVTLKAGHTHHGSGRSRAIEWVNAGREVSTCMKIHNGLHC